MDSRGKRENDGDIKSPSNSRRLCRQGFAPCAKLIPACAGMTIEGGGNDEEVVDSRRLGGGGAGSRE